MATASRWERLARLELSATDPDAAEAVLASIVAAVEELLPATGGASIVLYDRVTETYATSVTTVPGQTDEMAAERVRARRGATRAIIDEGRAVSVARLDDDPFGANPMLADFGMRSYLGVPIRDTADRVVGVLYALDRHEREHSADDIDFLEAVGRRAGVVIGNADALTRREHALAQTLTLLTVATAIRTTSPIAETVVVALHQLRARLGVEQAWVLPFQQSREVLPNVPSLDPADRLPPSLRDLPGRRIDSLDLAGLRLAVGSDDHDLFLAELVSGPSPIGLLVARRAAPFDGPEVAVLQGVADQLAVAIAGSQQVLALERSNHQLDVYASAISHDLRTPLATVLGFLELLDTHAAETLTVEARDWLHRAQRSADRMSGMITALLTHARVRQTALTPRQLDLRLLVAETVSLAAGEIVDGQADVHIGDLPDLVADHDAVAIVLQNLVSNALRYHGPDAPPSLTISGERTETGWDVHVRDRGPGVPEEHQDEIFEVFKRGAADPASPGLGIGLATARSLAEAMGGTLTVRNADDGGAVFTLSVPRVSPV